jgi:uncharacterized membrane protein
MKKDAWLILLSLAGALFSGYLSYSTLIAGMCPLNEGCAYFFGLPSCVYGFLIFAVLLALSIIALKNKKADKYIYYASIIGIIYAVYTSIIDLFFTACIGGCKYSLLLPSCVYGLAFYIAIFILSNKTRK